MQIEVLSRGGNQRHEDGALVQNLTDGTAQMVHASLKRAFQLP